MLSPDYTGNRQSRARQGIPGFGCNPDLNHALPIGFSGALRRAELAAIRVEHLEPCERGLRLTLPHSKGERRGGSPPPRRPGERRAEVRRAGSFA